MLAKIKTTPDDIINTLIVSALDAFWFGDFLFHCVLSVDILLLRSFYVCYQVHTTPW